MTTKFSTGISPEYVRNWDVGKAVREIIQNYLDSRSEFGCDGRIEWRNGIAYVRDSGPGLGVRHLALGVSEKSDQAIGKYGEGLKLALLVMAREGRNIEVRARGRVIRPTIEYDPNYQTETMMLEIREDSTVGAGTTVRFECSQEELEEGKGYFERFIKLRDDFQWVESGKISRPGGYVFINGARVGRLPRKALFSYHLDERFTGNIGNRDREVVDGYMLKIHVENLIRTTSSLEVIETLLGAMTSQEDVWELGLSASSWGYDKSKRKVWKRAFNSVYGKNVVLDEGNQQARVQSDYLGYQAITTPSFHWNELLKMIGVETCVSVVNKSGGGYNRVRLDELSKEEYDNFQRAKSLVEEHYNPVGTVIVADSLEQMTGASKGSQVNGAYSSSKDQIFLARHILVDLETTLHTLLHEAVHKHSGESDCTAGFERALTDVAVRMMLS